MNRRYIMKTILLYSILFCVFASSAFGELTPQDLEKISEIMDEKIQESEVRMKTHVTQEREKIDLKIQALDLKIQALDKLIERNFYFLIGLIALIAVVIAIPYRTDKKQGNLVQEVERLTKEMEKQHDSFVQEIERLTKEVETLKHQQTPSGT